MMLSTIFIPAVLVFFSPALSSSEFVFKQYINYTGFDDLESYTLPVVVVVGTLMAPITMVGYEAAATMSGEMERPKEDAPMAMIKTVAFSGAGGFLICIGFLFVCRDSADVILAGPTMQPVVNIFYYAFTKNADTGSIDSTANLYGVMLTILAIVNIFLNGFNHYTVVTRMAYAMARDDGLPASYYLKQLNPVTRIPDKIVLVVFVLESAACCLSLYSASAFAALLAISTAGL
jgi:amino acid transporter